MSLIIMMPLFTCALLRRISSVPNMKYLVNSFFHFFDSISFFLLILRRNVRQFYNVPFVSNLGTEISGTTWLSHFMNRHSYDTKIRNLPRPTWQSQRSTSRRHIQYLHPSKILLQMLKELFVLLIVFL